MDLLLNTLTEWLKELLAGAIASNLTGMVESVNTKVGDIAAQVGQTPQGWNSGIFHMIQNLSNNVILPIARYHSGAGHDHGIHPHHHG